MAGLSETVQASLDELRLTGLLLILAFVAFGIGATLPLLGKKGSLRFFNLDTRAYLANVAGNATTWYWANVFMGSAAVMLLGGLAMLTAVLEGANEHVLSRLGLIMYSLATVLWVIFSVWRAVVPVEAGRHTAATGAIPVYYEPLSRWAFVMFLVYAVLGFLALVAYGVALLNSALVPPWVAWATILFSLTVLVLLLRSGDTLPAFHYLPPLVIGIILAASG